MRFSWVSIFVLGVACSSTSPDASYPPNVGSLPVRALPDDDDDAFDDEDDAPEPEKPATPAAPTPVDPALPTKPATLSRKASCEQKKCALAAWLPDPTFAKAAGTDQESPAAMWTHSIAAGSVVTLPRHSHLTVLGVVTSGKVLVRAEEGGGAQKLDLWGAFRAPGGGVVLRADGEASEVVLAVTSSKATLAESLDLAKKKAFAVRWLKRPEAGALVVRNFDDVAPHTWAGGAVHARVAFGGDSAPQASLAILKISKDARVPEHDHPDSWEHLGALAGGAREAKIGGNAKSIGAGGVVSVEKGVKHSLPAGPDATVVVQIYTPSGPEQRYAGLAKDPKMGGAEAPAAK